MMKTKRGIVCEKKKHYTIFLTKKGEFLRGTPLEEPSNVGDEVAFLPIHRSPFFEREKRSFTLGIVMVAAILLFFIVSSLIPVSDRVMAYVQLETEKAVEFGVNEKGKVIVIRHLNEVKTDDFKEWKGKPLDIVLENAIKQFQSKDGQVVITTIFSDESEDTVRKLVDGAVQNVQKEHKHFSWKMMESTVEDREQANKKQMSVYKFKENIRKVSPQEKKDPKPAKQETIKTQEKQLKKTNQEQSKQTPSFTPKRHDNEQRSEKVERLDRLPEHRKPQEKMNKQKNKQESKHEKEQQSKPPAANENVHIHKRNPYEVQEVQVEQKRQQQKQRNEQRKKQQNEQRNKQQPPGLEKRPKEQIPPGLQ